MALIERTKILLIFHLEKTRGSAGLLLFVEISRLGLNSLINNQVNDDYGRVKHHLGIMGQALNDVARAAINGDIPPAYMNTNSLGAITNYVLQGENTTNDPNIESIGEKVIECYSDCEQR